MISKKNLVYLIERNLKEMAVDYGNNPERMNPDLERKLADKQHTYADNPGIPQERPEGIPSNFEELIASQRFIEIVNTVKRYTGFEGNITDQNSFSQLMLMMRQSMMDVLQFESQNKESLEQLAIELVRKEMSVPENLIQYDAKLVPIGGISEEGFQQQEQNPTDEEIEQQFGINDDEAADDVEQVINAFEKFNDEVAKRRLLNAMIQGSAKKGHYMFELVNERLEQMSNGIVRKYGILMSVNDSLYWLFPDEMLVSAGSGGGFAGKEEIDDETDPPTVRARGVFFPVLVHELIKGTVEILATQGLPDDKKSSDMVMNKADTLPSEIWDVRFGPFIWSKFVQTYPDRLFNEDKKYIQNYLVARFSALTSDEFFRLMKLILKGDERANQAIERMVQDIEQSLRNEDYEDDQYDREYGDENNQGGMDNWLNSLGISGNLDPDDEDDEDDDSPFQRR